MHHFGGNRHSVLLNTNLRVVFRGHKVGMCLALVLTAKLFSKVVEPVYTLTSEMWEFESLHICATTWCCQSF